MVLKQLEKRKRDVEQQEKIEVILEVSPNLKKIIKFATAEQIDNLVKDAQ